MQVSWPPSTQATNLAPRRPRCGGPNFATTARSLVGPGRVAVLRERLMTIWAARAA